MVRQMFVEESLHLMVDVFSSLICSKRADVLWLDACSCQESTICVDEVILACNKFAMFGTWPCAYEDCKVLISAYGWYAHFAWEIRINVLPWSGCWSCVSCWCWGPLVSSCFGSDAYRTFHFWHFRWRLWNPSMLSNRARLSRYALDVGGCLEDLFDLERG